MVKKPSLSVVRPGASGIAPPRTLGPSGLDLWRNVQHEFGITDAGGVALLMLACETLDLAAALAEAIERDGVTVYTNRGGPKPNPAVKDLLGARALVARTLEKLGITCEAIKPAAGRPPCPSGWLGE